MYGNNIRPYNNNFAQQNMFEQIDTQINQLQHMKEQMKNSVMQQPSINQTFQIAPTQQGNMRYANSIDEVNKEVVFIDTPFFSKDMSVLWLKNAKNQVKAYELKEIVEKDEKDIQIELLMAKISELEKEKENEQYITNVDEPKTTTSATKLDEPIGEQSKEKEPTSIQRVSTSKKK